MTDDQGYGDVGFTGNKNIVTPNIDQLASECYQFTNYHSGTTSAPTRSGLMTGQYGNSTGVWHTVLGRSILDDEEVTMGEIFVNNGYRTAMFGKWHLGDNYPYRPMDRGFQETLVHGGGGIGQAPDYWDNIYFDDTYWRNGVPEKQEGYCTDIWFDNAAKFIEEHKDEPFFCYISTNAPHAPYNIAEEYVAEFRDNSEIPEPRFYGMVKNIDDNVGRLRERIKELGLDKNTIVIFTTDNGTGGGSKADKDGFITEGYNANMRGKKGSTYEGGHRVPFLLSLPDVAAKEVQINTLVNHTDILPTLIDLCDLDIPSNHTFDGVSFAPLTKGGKIEDRIVVVDTQRGEYLEREKISCVMEGDWRLVNLNELYNLATDPGQTNNLAAQHPEMVERYRAAYDAWWDKVSVRADEYQEIYFRADGVPTQLSAHDIHIEGGYLSIVAQSGVRLGTKRHGLWAVKVEESGKYRIELLRYPSEVDLPLLSPAPAGRRTPPMNSRLGVGKALDIVGGHVQLGDYDEIIRINPETFTGKSIIFDIDAKAGTYMLDAEFIFSDESRGSAYNILVTRL